MNGQVDKEGEWSRSIVISTVVEKSFKFDFYNLFQRSLHFALLRSR